MKVSRTAASGSTLLDPNSSAWGTVTPVTMELFPTPVAIAAAVSPFMALSNDHGKVSRLEATALHNGNEIAVRLRWNSKEKSEIRNLDQFADAAAIMFGMTADAVAVTMGSAGNPVNSWLWRAGGGDPFDVLAEGYGTSVRRKSSESKLQARSDHRDGRWSVAFLRPLRVGDGFARIAAGGRSRVAFAVWEGSSSERAGKKAFSGDFVDLELEP